MSGYCKERGLRRQFLLVVIEGANSQDVTRLSILLSLLLYRGSETHGSRLCFRLSERASVDPSIPRPRSTSDTV